MCVSCAEFNASKCDTYAEVFGSISTPWINDVSYPCLFPCLYSLEYFSWLVMKYEQVSIMYIYAIYLQIVFAGGSARIQEEQLVPTSGILVLHRSRLASAAQQSDCTPQSLTLTCGQVLLIQLILSAWCYKALRLSG